MKIAFIAAICLVLVAEISAQWPRTCSDSDECYDDECCIRRIFIGGLCSKRLKKDEKCNSESVDVGGRYLGTCPCVEGLECIAESIRDTLFGKVRVNERCRVPGSSSPVPEITTKAPEITTPVPEITTPVPEVTTEDEPIVDTEEE